MAENRVEIHIEKAELRRAQEDAFVELNDILGRELQQRVTAKIWAWPNRTIKYSKAKRRRLKSGKLSKRRVLGVEGSPRDIVDNGGLRDSYKLVVKRKREAEHTYRADYALAVHNGAVFKSGRTMPARPWVRVTLREVNLERIFQTLVDRNNGRIRSP